MGIKHNHTVTATNNPAYEVSTTEYNSDHLVTGAGGVPAGTSFPGSPATNDIYFRTDRGLLYFYDGTRWLTVTLYHELATNPDGTGSSSTPPYTATANLGRNVIWANDYDLWLVELQAWFFTSGLSSSNYWTLTMAKGNTANSFTDIANVNCQSGTDSNWINKTASINALLGSSWATMRFTLAKTNTPNGCYCSAAYTYRLVG